jgi:hypothetical protein
VRWSGICADSIGKLPPIERRQLEQGCPVRRPLRPRSRALKRGVACCGCGRLDLEGDGWKQGQ